MREAKLTSEDILYAIIQEAQSVIDHVILGFEKETQALDNLSRNLSHVEKMDFARRAHEAKQAMIIFKLEIKSKS